QHGPGEPKPSLGGLIGIGRRADDDALAHWHPLQVGVERADYLLLHENAPFERFPAVCATVIGELGVGELAGVVRPLDNVAVRIARIAVAAAEFAPDVGVE